MTNLTRPLLLVSLLGLSVAAIASELTEKCDKCHGENGNSTDSKVASIAGFSREVLVDSLHEFQSGDRPAVKYKPKDGEETDMKAIADKLSDDEIEEVAEYYSKQKFIPRKQAFDAVLAKKGARLHKRKCEKCHSDNGSNADDDAAILAGQGREYLEEQFRLIASKERVVPKKMRKKFKKLKKKHLKELIEFYISQQ